MAPEPTNADHGLIHGVAAQASLAQHRVRQDRPRITILDHQDGQRRVASVIGEEAISTATSGAACAP
eukprot:12025282-Alexandrium_andersonii.AAC.1